MRLAPNDSRSYLQHGMVDVMFGDFPRGAADMRRALELNPNNTTIPFFLSWTEATAGSVDRAKELGAQAR